MYFGSSPPVADVPSMRGQCRVAPFKSRLSERDWCVEWALLEVLSFTPSAAPPARDPWLWWCFPTVNAYVVREYLVVRSSQYA